MPCKYITNMYAQEYAQEPLKCMVVSMSFHGDAWSIDASVREVLQCHGCHQLPCMEFMIGSCIITKMSCDAMMDCAVPSTWYEAKQSCQKNAKLRHPIEQVLILRSFADFCARFAEFCARFARPPFHIFSSFTHRSYKLATCSHPVQGHNGAAILTDEPSKCKPPPMKGPCLHQLIQEDPLWLLAMSQGLSFGDDPGCMYTLITSASAYASFKGMLVNSSLSENLNCKPNMSQNNSKGANRRTNEKSWA